MSSRLPQEILTDILVRLPVKSLVRFRSVSRSWDSLITSQMFIALHLNRSIEGHYYSSIILRHGDLHRRLELYTIYHDDDESFTKDQELEFPIKTYNYYYLCAGNGLLLFSNYETKNISIVLWNPSTRTCFQVPTPRFIDEAQCDIYGLGFDCRSGQYKVLRLIYAYYGYQIPREVEVYVLGTDKWRRVDTHVPFVKSQHPTQVYLHGAIHWIGCKANDYDSMVIVVFDLHEEMFRYIEIPSGIVLLYDCNFSLTIYETSLCFLECLGSASTLSIWVMKQYGVKESWVKHFTIEMYFQGGPNGMLGLRKHDKILVQNDFEELVSYDLKSGKVEQLVEGIRQDQDLVNRKSQFYGLRHEVFIRHNYHEAIPHMECLVLLNGTNAPEG